MDDSVPRPGPPGGVSRTPLQQRVDQGEEPRVILEELYRGMQGRLQARFYGWVKDARLAEDLVQEVFLKMHTKFAELIACEPVWPWVATVARNEFIDWWRWRRARGGGSDLLDDPDPPEEEADERSPAGSVQTQAEMWVVAVEPLLVHLRALVATGLLTDAHLHAEWYGVVEGVTQVELAGDLGVRQSRISQYKAELRDRVLASLYLCEVLGVVRPPHREAEIRSHLRLARLASGLTTDDRALLWCAGAAVRMDRDHVPELRPKNAQAAIESCLAGRVATLNDLHAAESAYAAAIPNPTPRCIASPCAAHRWASDQKA